MDTNTWVAVIGCVLIILATLFGRWWIQHLQYRKQNHTEVLDEERQKFLDRLDATFEPPKPIEERWPVFAVTKLDILTSAKDPAHPHGKHLMTFKSKNYNLDMGGVVYKFECLYCRHEAKLLKKDFWGTPVANRGVLYSPVDETISLSPIAEYMSRQREPKMPSSDRTDAMVTQLMAYAELTKKEGAITNPSEDPRYEIVQGYVAEGKLELAQALEERIWADIRAAAVAAGNYDD